MVNITLGHEDATSSTIGHKDYLARTGRRKIEHGQEVGLSPTSSLLEQQIEALRRKIDLLKVLVKPRVALSV
ncbi:hypothetical protein GOBAR_DD17577 [Gossypium barbadense]|nr:hypothetical protein GOBAR_DD17577 [Gossypium barbadense]